MEFSIKKRKPEKQRSACVVVGVFESRKLTLPAELLDRPPGLHISTSCGVATWMASRAPRAVAAQRSRHPCDRVLLVAWARKIPRKEYIAVRSAVKTLNETGAFPFPPNCRAKRAALPGGSVRPRHRRAGCHVQI